MDSLSLKQDLKIVQIMKNLRKTANKYLFKNE